MPTPVIYTENRLSRKRTLHAAAVVIMHKNEADMADGLTLGEAPNYMSMAELHRNLLDMGLGPVHSNELSDIWRYSPFFGRGELVKKEIGKIVTVCEIESIKKPGNSSD